jgi:hypothetical protein
MDLAFGATEGSTLPPVGVVSDRSNGFCCGVLCCFENGVQTYKMVIWMLLRNLRPTMKAAEAATGTTDATDTATNTAVAIRRDMGKPLSNGERIWSLHALLQQLTAGKLHPGTVATVAVEYGVSRHCVGALWKRGQESMNNGGGYLDVFHMMCLSGRKKIDYRTRYRI